MTAGAHRDITWHPTALNRDDRWLATDQRGCTVLLTGLSASGKSTIAVALERRLVERGQTAYLLDGDNIRHGLSVDLGFSQEERTEHIRRVGQVARLMADSGTVAVVSLIAPLASDREHFRAVHGGANLPFIEIFVDTSLEECARRDPKGLYAKAMAGEITGFTGIDAPYERPENPDLVVDTATTSVSDAVAQILELLKDRASVFAQGATMRISTKADCAVRAVIELAASTGEEPVPVQRITDTQNIPQPFLETILSELASCGVTSGTAAAGYRLARQPSAITIADVIRAVEGPLVTVRGSRPEEAHYPGAAGELPRVWIALRKNLRNVVERVTIADLAASKLPFEITALASDPEAWVTRRGLGD